jgi:hypothetical protein
MVYSLFAALSLIVPIMVLLGIVTYKIITKKELPDLRYTPFDEIMGQSPVAVHEEKEAKEEQDEHGDDIDKNERRK